MRRQILLIVTGLLFIGAIIGVWMGFSVPTEKTERVTHLTYEIEGNFDHQTFGKPPPEKNGESNPRYFRKIIDSVEVYFSYQFLPEKPVTDVTEEVVISALLDCRDWKKEVELVPLQEKKGDFSISFPFDPAPLIALTNNITDQLGAPRCSPDIVLKATVHTTAQSGAGVIEDDFVQTARVRLSGPSLEWDRELASSQIGYAKGVRYEHQGNTIKSEIQPPDIAVALKQADSYDSEAVNSINGTFAYSFTSDETLKEILNDVEVTAILDKGGGQQETFTLVPRTRKTGSFKVNFRLDVPFFYALIKSTEEQIGTSVPSHQLAINAAVHTIAQSNFGPIDETLTQSMTVTLEREKVLWPDTPPETKSGAIEETLTVPNPTAGLAKLGSLGALGVTAVIFLYTLWSYIVYRRRRISQLEADDIQVKGKHKDLVVDVEKLPDTKDEETLIELGSLDELVKVAESLLKPVLRLAEPERHIYCVIDGMARYQYVSLAEEPATPAPPPVEPPPTDETLSP